MSTDTIAFWHDSAARTPMLKPAQEITLGKTIQEWLTAEDPSPQLVRRGRKAKDRMIQSNMRLVISVCKKYSRRINRTANLEMVDLYQEGAIGLARGVEKFNPEAGYKLSTYAFWWISQAVRRVIEQHSTTIRLSNTAVQMGMRWRYRPEGQTLEVFAEAEGLTVERVRKFLEGFNMGHVVSLNALGGFGNDGDITLLDFVSTGELDEDEVEYTDILNELHHIPEIKDSLAVLEIAQEVKAKEMAPLLDCSSGGVRKILKDHAAIIREHLPADLRARLQGVEQNECVRIRDKIPAPVKELALVSCSSPMSEVSSNGHHSLEAEATAVIDELQELDAPKPSRKRRSSAEVAASGTVALKINGMDMEGSAADVAAVLKAYSV